MTDQISAIIVDDEKDARDGLESLINNFIPNVEIISKSENAQNALEIIIDKKPEVVLLDIQMPVNNGFWLADKLNKLQNSICIIFVTAFDEYAIKAIKHAAFDFITKPIDINKLNDSINRYILNKDGYNLNKKIEDLESYFQQDKLKINTQFGFVMILPSNIVYCEGNNNCDVHLANGKIEVLTSNMKIMEQKLTGTSFIKINKSTIINIDYLDSFDSKTKSVILSDVIQKYEFKANSAGIKKLLNT